ncbi:unnamed protein product [Paramecium sonneborni]|uniref:Cytidine deaminase n=1 Tax=Paramecium sonneborni TaxID=65129 RepID=A0A8S1P5K4_9CILI|nr:unnamed protein product [Paramecium sonneborni]
MEITEDQLIQEALKAKERAYCPYSNFRVGCSLLTKNNKLYTGCNVENASYGLCVCAERVAICKAVSEGDRQISTIVVSCDTDEPTFPCGMCRQTIIEFCYSGNDIKIIALGKDQSKPKYSKGSDVIPFAFVPKDLNVDPQLEKK